MPAHPVYAIACINMCAHAKDSVVHVRVRWIMETLKHPAYTVGCVARLCRSWLSPEFSMGEISLGQYSCKKKNTHVTICKFPTTLAATLRL